MSLTEKIHVENVLDKVLLYSRKNNFRGHNKHDGLNSPVLSALLGWGKWPRMVAIQGVMRFPVNLRPVLLVPKTYNPKGLSLFVRGLLSRYDVTRKKQFLDDAEKLLDILASIKSPGQWSGCCWGYHYPWRDPGFFAPVNTPNAVVSAFVCEALLDAYAITKRSSYLNAVASCIEFFVNDLTVLKDTKSELCLSYMPLPMNMRVMDVSILIGAVIGRYGHLARDKKYDEIGFRLVNYVVNRQTDEGAWYYTDPPDQSHIRHDNYHTGFILDALSRYMESSSNYTWRHTYDVGLDFYAKKLFNKDGSPRWMSHIDYPHDIHGAAQGIITFSRHNGEYPHLAMKIAEWALENMYSKEGRFFYQKTRRYTKKFTLLRWCNGWMYLALALYIASLEKFR